MDPDSLIERVSRRIAEVRTSKGITQAAVAERLGIADKNYQRIELGQQNLTLTSLARIADAIGVDPIAFFEEPSDTR